MIERQLKERVPMIWVMATLLICVAAQAETPTLNTTPDFPTILTNPTAHVAVVTATCHPSLDCRSIEKNLNIGLSNLNPGFALAPPNDTRAALFQLGATKYTPDLREPLCFNLDAAALIELNIPHAHHGVGRLTPSRVKLSLSIVTAEGRLLAAGETSPTGPTSPESLAVDAALSILREALGCILSNPEPGSPLPAEWICPRR